MIIKFINILTRSTETNMKRIGEKERDDKVSLKALTLRVIYRQHMKLIIKKKTLFAKISC